MTSSVLGKLTLICVLSIVVISGHTHPQYAHADPSPQLILPFTLIPPAIDGKWKDEWNHGLLVDVVNVLPTGKGPGQDYTYSGKSGYAYARLMHDSRWIYGNVEYLPPPDDNGRRGFVPGWLAIYVDSNDSKSSIPQKSDYDIDVFGTNQSASILDVIPSLAPNRGEMYYTYGAGNGYWTKEELGNKVDNASGSSAFSVIATPTFDTPHPYYEFKISIEKFGIKNPFGLGFLIGDFDVVTEKGGWHLYVATFPPNDLGFNMPNIVFSPNLWADAYLGAGEEVGWTFNVDSPTSFHVNMTTTMHSQGTGVNFSFQSTKVQVWSLNLSAYELGTMKSLIVNQDAEGPLTEIIVKFPKPEADGYRFTVLFDVLSTTPQQASDGSYVLAWNWRAQEKTTVSQTVTMLLPMEYKLTALFPSSLNYTSATQLSTGRLAVYFEPHENQGESSWTIYYTPLLKEMTQTSSVVSTPSGAGSRYDIFTAIAVLGSASIVSLVIGLLISRTRGKKKHPFGETNGCV